jgi:hypothetical protein
VWFQLFACLCMTALGREEVHDSPRTSSGVSIKVPSHVLIERETNCGHRGLEVRSCVNGQLKQELTRLLPRSRRAAVFVPWWRLWASYSCPRRDRTQVGSLFVSTPRSHTGRVAICVHNAMLAHRSGNLPHTHKTVSRREATSALDCQR